MSGRVLYVGGLADGVSDRQLRELFGVYGIVRRAYVVRQRQTGQSAGYGFVEMGSGEQALTAVVALEGTLFDGRCLCISVTPYRSGAS